MSTDWMPRAACVGLDTDLFFPSEKSRKVHEETLAALRICAGCPVRQACLADELSRPVSDQNGIRGGMTAAERRPLAPKRRQPLVQARAERCNVCDRPMRPGHTRVADWPGTCARWSVDQCQTCAKKEKRREKVA